MALIVTTTEIPMEISQGLKIQLCAWLYGQGKLNCLFDIDGETYALNQTLGLRKATEGDRVNPDIPQMEPPDFFLDAITAG